MENIQFIVEIKEEINMNDLVYLRQLYSVIAKKEAINLYENLFDNYWMNKSQNTYMNLRFLLENQGITIFELSRQRKMLEALGLLRTFESSDEQKMVFVLSKPHSPAKFRNNKYLYNLFLKNSSEIMFERIFYANRDHAIAKDDFIETTANYDDLFNINEQVSLGKIETTLEFEIPDTMNIDEALSTLNSFKFIYFSTKRRATKQEILLINSLKNWGFSNHSINLLIDYSMMKNGNIIKKYIEVIAKDLIKKDIKSTKEIKQHLDNAVKIKKQTFYSAPKQTTSEKENTETWDEIFSSIGDF